ncbi:MAG: hypothetical protein HZB71_11035 [Betaproteobacteria bacterium]|nr:hypothetical protein [Betaproteobacteria bacterium]
MNASKTTLTLALTTAIGVATGVSSIAHAAGNPFAMQSLSHGYLVAAADEKAMDGKCGGVKGAKDGKCGGAHAAVSDKMVMMEVWLNKDQAGGFGLDSLAQGIPVMMMMKDGKMVLVPVLINRDQAGGFSFAELSKGVPVMMKAMEKDGKMMMVPVWMKHEDQVGGFSFEEFAKHRSDH